MDIKANLGNSKNPADFTLTEVIKYKGREWNRMAITANNFRRASPYIAGCFVATALLYPLLTYISKNAIEGADGKGGNFLRLTTKYSNDDIEYTREFQRMLYLTESMNYISAKSADTENFLKMNGEFQEQRRPVSISKTAPHHKYYGS